MHCMVPKNFFYTSLMEILRERGVSKANAILICEYGRRNEQVIAGGGIYYNRIEGCWCQHE